MHNGHRDRMRERVLSVGAASLADHELLEMLLYYAQPRRDTNETAHLLIEECGSLSAVLESERERLCRVPYVKENAALYLQLLGELSRRYAVAKFSPDATSIGVVYDSLEKLATVLYPRFLGQSKELLLAVLFDARMRMVDLFVVAEGTLNGVAMTARTVTQRAYARNAAFCVLAHNHPGGIATPSQEDVKLTRDMETALELVGVPLIEHLVFTEQAYFPIVANCIEGQEPAPLSKAAQYRRLLYQSKKGK
jgi:DNA repair protein RadC